MMSGCQTLCTKVVQHSSHDDGLFGEQQIDIRYWQAWIDLLGKKSVSRHLLNILSGGIHDKSCTSGPESNGE